MDGPTALQAPSLRASAPEVVVSALLEATDARNFCRTLSAASWTILARCLA